MVFVASREDGGDVSLELRLNAQANCLHFDMCWGL